MNTEPTLAECDFNLWECLVVNSHNTQTVISDEMLIDMGGIFGVVRIFRLGSYGMELIVITDTEDTSKEAIIASIQGIIANASGEGREGEMPESN